MASDAAIALYEYQKRWLADKSRFKIGLWSRQTGKSFTVSLEAALDCYDHRTDWVFLSAGERQAKEMIRKAKMHVMALNCAFREVEEEFKHENTTFKQLEIHLPNGSRMLALPANPDTARGHSANIVLDEFAFHADSREIWAALFPTITRGYCIRIVSTPQGRKNKFYQLWSGNPLYSKHKVTIHEAMQGGLTLMDESGQVVGPDYLREALDDPEAWQQEYECEFVDEATAYLTYEMISACEDQTLDFENDLSRLGSGPRYAGVDIGRKKHLTVYWCLEKIGDVLWTRRIAELDNMDFRAQHDTITSFLAEDRPYRVCVDSTGLGMQLGEELQSSYGRTRVELISFGQAVKEDLAVTLRRRFEERTIRIPVDRKIREDFHNVRRIVTAAGNIRFDADDTKDGHSDRFWASALAIHAAKSSHEHIGEILLGERRMVITDLSQYSDMMKIAYF